MSDDKLTDEVSVRACGNLTHTWGTVYCQTKDCGKPILSAKWLLTLLRMNKMLLNEYKERLAAARREVDEARKERDARSAMLHAILKWAHVVGDETFNVDMRDKVESLLFASPASAPKPA